MTWSEYDLENMSVEELKEAYITAVGADWFSDARRIRKTIEYKTQIIRK